MKTSAFLSLCIDPELQQMVEQVLREGETLSSFVEQSIRRSVERRQIERKYIGRQERFAADARRPDTYVSSDTVIARLEQLLASAKAADTKRHR